MSSHLLKHTYQLEAISPVHIGNGVEHGPLDFIVEGNQAIIINTDKLFETLEEGQRKELVKQLEELEEDFQISLFLRKIGLSPVKVSKYGLFISSKNMPKRIKEFIKNGKNQTYIPGSSIKGVIRTAALYSIMRNNTALLEKARNEIFNRLRSVRGKGGWAIKRLKKQIGSVVEEIGLRGAPRSAPYWDVFKFLQVSDCEAKKTNESLEISEVKILSSMPSGYRYKGFPIFIENLRKEIEFKGMITLDRTFLEKYNGRYKKQFSGVLSSVMNVEELSRMCNEFAKDVIRNELAFYRGLNLTSLVNFYQNLSGMNFSNKECLIRIGWGIGHQNTTIGLLLYEDVLFDEIRRTFRLGRQGVEIFPKSKKLLVNEESLPIGWAKLKFF